MPKDKQAEQSMKMQWRVDDFTIPEDKDELALLSIPVTLFFLFRFFLFFFAFSLLCGLYY